MTNINFKGIEDYVNKAIAAYAIPINNVESVQCRRINDEVYIELVHESGTVRYFDVSGKSISDIGIMFGHIVANNPIRCEIRDTEARKAVRKLFR